MPIPIAPDEAFATRQIELLNRISATDIEDATRVRALKIYNNHTQANAIDFVDRITEKFPFLIKEIRTDNPVLGLSKGTMSSRPSSTGMSKTKASGTHISSAEPLS